MFQPKHRRTLAAAAIAALTSLLPLSGLQAAPRGQQRPLGEVRAQERRLEQREISFGRFLLDLWEKLGMRIDDNGAKLTISNDDTVVEIGMRIDDNG